jgi:hypothetical protein
MNVAQTIASQLGNKALFMIGAKNLMAGTDYLQLRIGRNNKGWNALKIALNGLDLYDLTFYKIRKLKIADKKTIDNIYVDQLHDIIESETGLRTSL